MHSDFNPRSREGSDIITVIILIGYKISIHAPAKGATFSDDLSFSVSGISIHAPAKGATLLILIFHLLQIFQSTLPRRERHALRRVSSSIMSISIHAPAKGATVMIRQGLQVWKFQSTLPRRERQAPRFTFKYTFEFQSTLPRRERRYNLDNDNKDDKISIHAPAKGATLYGFYIICSIYISIHAPAKGATKCMVKFFYTTSISIHAPAKGATRPRF